MTFISRHLACSVAPPPHICPLISNLSSPHSCCHFSNDTRFNVFDLVTYFRCKAKLKKQKQRENVQKVRGGARVVTINRTASEGAQAKEGEGSTATGREEKQAEMKVLGSDLVEQLQLTD